MSSGDLAVRDARSEDAADLVNLINEAYIVEQFFVTGPRIAETDVRTLMGKGTFLVGWTAANEIIATVYLEKRSDRGYIGLLSVSPGLQGQGLGSRMMQAAEHRLAAEGCTVVDIRVVSLRTELPPFYEKLGYRHQGTEAFDDPRKTRACHFLKMSKDIQV